MALAVSCNDPVVDNNGEINSPQPEVPQPRPDEPASIELGGRYLFAESGGAVKSVDVEVNSDWEWSITTSDEWFSAERVDDKLVVTLSESATMSSSRRRL